MSASWTVERARGSAAAFHARDLLDPAARLVSLFEPDAPALVLGSAQPHESVDTAACVAAGVDVVRRRSGGGAVLLVPGDVLWVDVVVPVGDPLWDDDVGRATHWLGAAWAAALAACGRPNARVHHGPMVRSSWSSLACFAGVGAGEVLLDGRKVVGVSQRRIRRGARFQCAAHRRFDPGAIAGLLALDPVARADLTADLAAGVATVGVPLEELASAFLAALPA